MRAAVIALALAMLVTGTINTVSTKYQDKTVVGQDAEGRPIYFRHPAVQAAFMFLGESLCLVPYFVLRWRKWARRRAGLEPASKRPKQPRSFFLRRALMFAIPALCDSVATTLLNLGLFYTNASTYQMLRGTLVLFAGMFTLLILRRRLFIHHWLGMLIITAGAAIVGAASIVYSPHAPALPPPPSPTLTDDALAATGSAASAAGALSQLWSHWNPVTRTSLVVQRLREEGSADPLFGDIMVVVAQGFAALQFILEEKLLGSFRMQPLVAVGLEGMWGVLLCLVALPILGQVRDSKGLPLDDLPGAAREIASSPQLALAVAIGILSIGFFNFFGLSVTKALSGASRATIDACRTMFVWLVALWAGWESFHGLQVVGFLVLFSGTSLYNEILRSCLPHAYPPTSTQDSLQSLDDDSYSSTSSQGSADRHGNGDLEAPLLGQAFLPDGQGGNGNGNASGAGRGGAGARSAHAAPVAMQRHREHQQAQYHMARSMRLGVTTLSPRALDEDPTPFSTNRIPVSDILDVSPISASLATNPDGRGLLYGQNSEALSESDTQLVVPGGGNRVDGAGVMGGQAGGGVRGQGQLAQQGAGQAAALGAAGQGLMVGAGWGGGPRSGPAAAAGSSTSAAPAGPTITTSPPSSSPVPLPAVAPAHFVHEPPKGLVVPVPQPAVPRLASSHNTPPPHGPGPVASTGTAQWAADAGIHATGPPAAGVGSFALSGGAEGGAQGARRAKPEPEPEEVPHPTHAYHPGGGLQHALAAAGDPAAHVVAVDGAAVPVSGGSGGAAALQVLAAGDRAVAAVPAEAAADVGSASGQRAVAAATPASVSAQEAAADPAAAAAVTQTVPQPGVQGEEEGEDDEEDRAAPSASSSVPTSQKPSSSGAAPGGPRGGGKKKKKGKKK